jgi:hypothetical protein
MSCLDLPHQKKTSTVLQSQRLECARYCPTRSTLCSRRVRSHVAAVPPTHARLLRPPRVRLHSRSPAVRRHRDVVRTVAQECGVGGRPEFGCTQDPLQRVLKFDCKPDPLQCVLQYVIVRKVVERNTDPDQHYSTRGKRREREERDWKRERG